MKIKCVLLGMTLAVSSCATMSESMQLGVGMGAATGTAATLIAHSAATGQSPAFETVALGAGVGMGIGLLTSYLVHKNVEEKRSTLQAEQTEYYFGDLPPSPFAVPKMPLSKGGR